MVAGVNRLSAFLLALFVAPGVALRMAFATISVRFVVAASAHPATNADSRGVAARSRSEEERCADSANRKEKALLLILKMTNFTAFGSVRLQFAEGLNVIVGDNGLGKTHLLKLPYSIAAASAEAGRRPDAGKPTKSALRTRLAEKMRNVFRPESLGHLTRRPGRRRCAVDLEFIDSATSVGFEFTSRSRSEVSVVRGAKAWCDRMPVFLPARELLTIYPGFVSLYEMRKLEFDETWRDTCLLLGAPTLRRPSAESARLLDLLRNRMGGQLVLDANGRFYLDQPGAGRFEMPLVAEGGRKLGMLARLISTGHLGGKGCLFWDEPDADLNPKLARVIARAVLGLCESGNQAVVATHSLFLLREFDMLGSSDFQGVSRRYFALRRGADGVEVSQGDTVDDVEPLLALDEELAQSDRFLKSRIP